MLAAAAGSSAGEVTGPPLWGASGVSFITWSYFSAWSRFRA